MDKAYNLILPQKIKKCQGGNIMKYADEIREQYYDLEEFIEDLQDLVEEYKGRIPKNYLDQIDETWCEAKNEMEMLEPMVEQIESEEE